MAAVVISLAGTDVTANVQFADARFKSLVNGQPGDAYMRVRDLDSTFSVTEGADWLVTVDGSAVWRGFVTKVSRVYIFPAGNVAESGLQRWFDIEGSDLNLLFTRRVVENQATPTTVQGTQFPAATADTTAITELLANWLDLSSDSLDTTTGVTHVGNLDPAQVTRAWSGGWYWSDAMNSIAMLPAAIYYLRPETGSPRGTLVYCDMDTPTAPFGLSDQPNGTTTKGFREAEIILDGTSLANDVLAWGMGYGSQAPVFKRAQDATSQTAHGLWQTAQVTTGIYQQTTIDRVATSILDGSPTNHRGAKDDRPGVDLVTYEPGLLAGHVVAFTSNVWGWSDTLPVRQMEVTFDAPDVPRYKLLLSHQIDSPWSFLDQFWPSIPKGGQYVLPGFQTTSSGACDCGITDTFTRTVSPGLGTSDSGFPWVTPLIANGYPADGNDADFSVNGTQGVIDTSVVDPFTFYVSQVLEGSYTLPFTMTMHYTATNVTLPKILAWGINIFPSKNLFATVGAYLELYTNPGGGGSGSANLGISVNASAALTDSHIDPGAPGSLMAFSGLPFTVKVEVTTAGVSGKFWYDTDTEPVAYQVSVAGPLPAVLTSLNWFYNGDQDAAGAIRMDYLDITNVNRCTAIQFDNFERTVASGWGTATPNGGTWAIGTAGAAYSVNGTTGVMGMSAFAYSDISIPVSMPVPDTGTIDIILPSVDLSLDNRLFVHVTANATPSASNDTVAIFSRATDSSGNPHTPGWWIQATRDGTSQSFSPSPAGWYFLGSSGAYRVKWTLDSLSLSASAWLISTAEPVSWQSVCTVASAVTSTPGMDIDARFESVPSTLYFDNLDFDYTGRPCYYSGGTPVYAGAGTPATSPTGWGCENLTRSSSTVYTTTVNFQPSSTFVWRDGLLQRRGTDYTEGADHRTLTFSAAVASTSSMRVCYFAEATT